MSPRQAKVAAGLLPGGHDVPFAEIEVTESGMLVYAFPDVQRLPEKGMSRGILDE